MAKYLNKRTGVEWDITDVDHMGWLSRDADYVVLADDQAPAGEPDETTVVVTVTDALDVTVEEVPSAEAEPVEKPVEKRTPKKRAPVRKTP